MAEFPDFSFSKTDVRKAGKALSGKFGPNGVGGMEAIEIFRIANNWRDSHAYPMQRVRAQVVGQLNRLRHKGRLTAARLKRMQSIRKKLHRLHLDKIQDLAGVRVILPTIHDVELMLSACREGLHHTIYGEDDYIAAPKVSGYRSHHLKLMYVPSGEADAQFQDRRVELQVRTGRQHSWATANETVGLFRGEDLKGGAGDPDWRRLFALMASEIAHIEGRPTLAGAPERKDRVRELRDLNKRLGAAAFLDSINQAVDFTDRHYNPTASEFLLIRYDLQSRSVEVNGFDVSSGTRMYYDAERLGGRYDSVLVATDKIDSLKRAFPNYFGDVQHFARALRRIIKGQDAAEYVLKAQEIIAQPPKHLVDPRWLRRSSSQRGRYR